MTDQGTIEEPLMDQILSRTIELLKSTNLFDENLVESLQRLAEEGKLSSHEDIITILKQGQGNIS
jgi:hypothetical protein